ncbi:MAG: hypothetical protein HY735_33050 [Verrucomicrobia bacterium]|nr:hypothetical protein [Verrucomicrobiota bacterium]
MKAHIPLRCHALVATLLVLLSAGGCSKSGEEVVPAAKTPDQAASGLDQTFATAPPVVRENVTAASEALRRRDYEKAVVSLHSVQQAPQITLQQGMAIHNSSVLLEAELIKAIERGDPRAKAAYELLKRSRRN